MQGRDSTRKSFLHETRVKMPDRSKMSPSCSAVALDMPGALGVPSVPGGLWLGLVLGAYFAPEGCGFVILLNVDLDRADRAAVAEPCPQPPFNVTVLSCPLMAAAAMSCQG